MMVRLGAKLAALKSKDAVAAKLDLAHCSSRAAPHYYETKFLLYVN
jgi:hypothetical protein